MYAQLTALADLRRRLNGMGAKVLVAKGEVTAIFEKLLNSLSVSQIHSHEETGNWISFQRDLRLQQWCKKKAVDWYEIPQTGVIRRLASRAVRQSMIQQRLFNTDQLESPLRVPQSSVM